MLRDVRRTLKHVWRVAVGRRVREMHDCGAQMGITKGSGLGVVWQVGKGETAAPKRCLRAAALNALLRELVALSERAVCPRAGDGGE